MNDVNCQGQSGPRYFKGVKEDMKHFPDELFAEKYGILVFINVTILYVSLILLRNFKRNS